MVENPILSGFNPDPSICRVDDDYFIATSTFEWYPGVQIHHSRDLEHWQLIHRPLDRAALLDLRGVPDSCGVWAPCLSWHQGLFYLCYTVVRRFDGNFKDTHNYLTTAAEIHGPWSDPVYLNSSGFDPSMFHDHDGRHWYVNMVWDHRPDRTFFAGVNLQEYSAQSRGLLGEPRRIFTGSTAGLTEGPHLYRYGDWYYLLTAEGGTGYEHLATMARSRCVEGPYELDPAGSVVTARHEPAHPLQRAGHADIVQAADGRFFMVHLCSRPLPGTRRSTLGRETAIQSLEWTDDQWFRLASGGHLPQVSFRGLPHDQQATAAPGKVRYDFSGTSLHPDFQWLRSPQPARLFSLGERPGCLRLYGRESPGSLFEQSLVARRQQHHRCEVTTQVHFEPNNFQQMAGLACYYNSSKFHYLYISHDEETGRHLAIISCEGQSHLEATFPDYAGRVALPDGADVHLRARIDGADLQFSYSMDGGHWQAVGTVLDASLLSDEAGRGEGAHFTGTLLGMMANDGSGAGLPADFHYFEYRPG